TVFREPPYPFDYPMRRLTMEEMLAKFIDEGRCEHEEMEIFIKEFRTTNELLLKTRSNLLSELKIEVNELSKVVSNVLTPKNEVKGVTTRGGMMTSEVTRSKEINETEINKNEPPRFEQDVPEKPHDDGVSKFLRKNFAIFYSWSPRKVIQYAALSFSIRRIEPTTRPYIYRRP
ncbi:hypothetical protein Tco_1425089, partial [Tanacetum coccineum]